MWGDESFSRFSTTQKLSWIALLTHKTMTPMGAGTFPSLLLDSLIGYDGSCICPVCLEESNEVGSSERILEGFEKGSMILRDGDLVIVKNFLVYNRPDNPNQLHGWIEWCEELPRSIMFETLRDHLNNVLNGEPEWLFAGLINPLAEQKNKTLKSGYWDRISQYVKKPEGRTKKGSKKRIKEPSKKRIKEPSKKRIKEGTKMVPCNQELELEQELEQELEKDKSKPIVQKPTKESYKAANGKILKGDVLTRFEEFLEAFSSKAGKADAANSWLKIDSTKRPVGDELFAKIMAGAKRYAAKRPSIKQKGSTPKMAQGWLTSRRWEDEDTSGNGRSQTRDPNGFKFDEE